MNKLTGILQDNQPTISVSITETGATGPQGPTGRSAYEVWLDDGNRGNMSDFLESLKSTHIDSFIHTQMLAADEWTIEHDLDKHPSVTVVDSANSVVHGNVEYINKNKLKVSFIGAFSGKAYLN